MNITKEIETSRMHILHTDNRPLRKPYSSRSPTLWPWPTQTIKNGSNRLTALSLSTASFLSTSNKHKARSERAYSRQNRAEVTQNQIIINKTRTHTDQSMPGHLAHLFPKNNNKNITFCYVNTNRFHLEFVLSNPPKHHTKAICHPCLSSPIKITYSKNL